MEDIGYGIAVRRGRACGCDLAPRIRAIFRPPAAHCRRRTITEQRGLRRASRGQLATTLVWSTYLGGNYGRRRPMRSRWIARGNVLIAGATESNGGLPMVGALSGQQPGATGCTSGDPAAPMATRCGLAATWVGGPATMGYGVATDASRWCCSVAGTTNSSQLPDSTMPFQATSGAAEAVMRLWRG